MIETEDQRPQDLMPAIRQALEIALQHHSAGRLSEAEMGYQQVLKEDPDQPGALHLLGVIAYQKKEHDIAVDLIGKALTIKPDFAEAHCNLGLVLKELGKLDEAVASYKKALAIKPDAAEVHHNLGLVLRELRKRDEAVASFHKALTIKPDFAEAHNSLGVALRELGKLNEAAESYHQALAFKPDFAEAHNNLGSAFKDLGRLDDAVASYRKALTIKPDYAEAHSNLLFSLNYESEVSQADIMEESRHWDRQHASVFTETPSHDNSRVPDRRLRIGYVSPDMCTHSVSYFFEPLLTAHGPSVVEIICYADVAVPDATTRRLEGQADHWRRTIGMDDVTLAKTIRTDGVDILVDLAGHTAKNRLLVFARRPSPVQISWLGYPNTTGLAAMNYRLVDAITDPGNEASETLVRLPNGFLCYQPAQDAPPRSQSRTPGPMTFGSFNNATKLSKSCVELWARVLAKVPESRLLIKSTQFSDVAAQELVRARFANHNIDPGRLDLRGRMDSSKDHLGLYEEVDVCLDPFPYNGTTTTCEALWMGVPVVTLRGEHHRGRVGASILSRVGLDEYVAADADTYVSIAAGLAGDSARQIALSSGLRERMAPLCDAKSFARDMEAAYRSMWRDWCD